MIYVELCRVFLFVYIFVKIFKFDIWNIYVSIFVKGFILKKDVRLNIYFKYFDLICIDFDKLLSVFDYVYYFFFSF